MPDGKYLYIYKARLGLVIVKQSWQRGAIWDSELKTIRSSELTDLHNSLKIVIFFLFS